MSTILDDATFTNCGTSAGKANRSPAQCPLQQYKRAASAKEAASSAISCAAQVAIHRVATICASKVCATDSYTAVNAACQASTILAAVANVAIRRVTCMTQCEAKPVQTEVMPASLACPPETPALHSRVSTGNANSRNRWNGEVMPTLLSGISGASASHPKACTGKGFPHDKLKAQTDKRSEVPKVRPPDGPRPGFTRFGPVRRTSTAPSPWQEDPGTPSRRGQRPCKASSPKLAIVQQQSCGLLSDQVCSSPHRRSKCFQEQRFEKPGSAQVRAWSSQHQRYAGAAEMLSVLREPSSLRGIGSLRDVLDGPSTSRSRNTDLPSTPGSASSRCQSLYTRNAWRRRTWSGKLLDPLPLQQANLG